MRKLFASLIVALSLLVQAHAASVLLLAVAPPGATFTFLGSEGETADPGGIATFTTINIGSASANRDIIVSIMTASGGTISSVTVGGVSIAQDIAFVPSRGVFMWSGLVTSGAGVQNIVVTTTLGFQEVALQAWSGVGMSNTGGAAYTKQEAGTSSDTVSVTAGDLLIATMAFGAAVDGGSTQAPSNVRSVTHGGFTSTTFDWNKIISTNAAFTVALSIANQWIIAGYR